MILNDVGICSQRIIDNIIFRIRKDSGSYDIDRG